MNFSEALNSTKEGLNIVRKDWDASKHLTIVTGPDGEPLLALTETRTDISAWVPTMQDLFADDWEVRENG
jgi:hypothetical protein